MPGIEDLFNEHSGTPPGNKGPKKPQSVEDLFSEAAKRQPKGTGLSKTSHINLDEYLPWSPNGVSTDWNEDKVRAQNQGFWESSGKRLLNLVPNIAGTLVESVGYLGSLGSEYGDDRDYNNWLTQFGNSMKNPFGQVYRENPNQVWDLSDPAWWGDAFFGLAESAISFGVEGAGLAKVLGGITKLAQVERLGKTAGQLARGTNMLSTSALMAYTEGAMSGATVFDQTYQSQLQKAIDEGVQYSEASKRATHLASNAAAATVQLNTMINTILNLPQLAPIFKHDDDILAWFTGVGRRQKGESFQTWSDRIKATTPESADVRKLFNPRGVDLLRKQAGNMLSEGSEEVVNVFAEQRGIERGKTGKELRGLGDLLGDMEHFLDDAMTSEGALNFVLGAFGGVAQNVVLESIPMHKVYRSVDGKDTKHAYDGQMTEDGKYKARYVSSRTRNSVGARNHFENVKQQLVNDIDRINDLSTKLATAIANKDQVEASVLRGQLFNTGALNAVQLGLASSFADQYEQIAKIDNEKFLGAPYAEQAAQLKQAMDAEQDPVKKAEMAQQHAQLTKQATDLAEVTEAMQKGYARSKDDNEYKLRAKKAVDDIHEYDKLWKDISDKHRSSDEWDGRYADYLFGKEVAVRQMGKALEDYRKNIQRQEAERDNLLKPEEDATELRDMSEALAAGTAHANLSKDLEAIRTAIAKAQKPETKAEADKALAALMEKYLPNADSEDNLAGPARKIAGKLQQELKAMNDKIVEKLNAIATSERFAAWQAKNKDKDVHAYLEMLKKWNFEDEVIAQHKASAAQYEVQHNLQKNELLELRGRKGRADYIRMAKKTHNQIAKGLKKKIDEQNKAFLEDLYDESNTKKLTIIQRNQYRKKLLERKAELEKQLIPVTEEYNAEARLVKEFQYNGMIARLMNSPMYLKHLNAMKRAKKQMDNIKAELARIARILGEVDEAENTGEEVVPEEIVPQGPTQEEQEEETDAQTEAMKQLVGVVGALPISDNIKAEILTDLEALEMSVQMDPSSFSMDALAPHVQAGHITSDQAALILTKAQEVFNQAPDTAEEPVLEETAAELSASTVPVTPSDIDMYEDLMARVTMTNDLLTLSGIRSIAEDNLPATATRDSLVAMINKKMAGIKLQLRKNEIESMVPVSVKGKTHYVQLSPRGKLVIYRPTKRGYSKVGPGTNGAAAIYNTVLQNTYVQAVLASQVIAGIANLYNNLEDTYDIRNELDKIFSPNLSLDARRAKVLSRDPESMEEEILQAFVRGQKLSQKAFTDKTGMGSTNRRTGAKVGVADLKSYKWALAADGTLPDLWAQESADRYGEDERDFEEAIVDALRDNVTMASMIERLETLQQEATPMGYGPIPLELQKEELITELAPVLSRHYGTDITGDTAAAVLDKIVNPEEMPIAEEDVTETEAETDLETNDIPEEDLPDSNVGQSLNVDIVTYTEFSPDRHAGKKITDVMSVANLTHLYEESITDINGESAYVMNSTGDINPNINPHYLAPGHIKAGTKVMLTIDTAWNGTKNEDDVYDETTPGPRQVADSFDMYQGTDGKIPDDAIDEVPIKIVDVATGTTIGYVRRVGWINAQYPNETNDYRNVVDVLKDKDGNVIDPNNVRTQTQEIRRIRAKVVAAYNIGARSGVPSTITNRTAGTAVRTTPGKVSELIPEDVPLALFTAEGRVLTAIGSPSSAQVSPFLTKAREGKRMYWNVPGVLVRDAAGNQHFEPIWVEKLGKADVDTVVRAIEVYLAHSNNAVSEEARTRAAADAQTIEEATGFDISTAEGLQAFINQYYHYTQSFSDQLVKANQEILGGQKRVPEFRLSIGRRAPSGSNKNTIKAGVMYMNKLAKAAIDGDGKLNPDFIALLQDEGMGLRSRFRNVVFENTEKGLVGMNSRGPFTEVVYQPVSGSFRTVRHDSYNAMVKNISQTTLDGRQSVEVDGKKHHVYFANPVTSFSAQQVRDARPAELASIEPQVDTKPLQTGEAQKGFLESLPGMVGQDNNDDDSFSRVVNVVGRNEGRAVNLANLQDMRTFTPIEQRNGRTPEEVLLELNRLGITEMPDGFNPFRTCR